MFEGFRVGFGYTLGKVAACAAALFMLNSYVNHVIAKEKEESQEKSDK